jgi:hypothetical protein
MYSPIVASAIGAMRNSAEDAAASLKSFAHVYARRDLRVPELPMSTGAWLNIRLGQRIFSLRSHGESVRTARHD